MDGPQSGEDSARLLEHLTAERAWYDVATTHLGSLVARLRSEMEARVPEVQRSGTWSRPRFSYYTAGRKKQGLHGDLARKS